ncbi:uncharacterized protein [Zea mays]|uniref:uncharacterized protein n=1 Tax=Zea mays TaxID=4577 RepID=UPI0004DE9BA6|nr:uncharacterized protein LOC103652737 [Zea mays]|eukprot:XP_008677918.1 uncharacterized protein LOC103652737 [Zea mays]
MVTAITTRKIIILMVATVAMVALFPAGTTAVKYGMCQTQCQEIQPNCDAWCKRIGYPKGGECIAPHYHNCCCWLVPPSSDSDKQLNGTAAGSFHNRTLHV